MLGRAGGCVCIAEADVRGMQQEARQEAWLEAAMKKDRRSVCACRRGGRFVYQVSKQIPVQHCTALTSTVTCTLTDTCVVVPPQPSRHQEGFFDTRFRAYKKRRKERHSYVAYALGRESRKGAVEHSSYICL